MSRQTTHKNTSLLSTGCGGIIAIIIIVILIAAYFLITKRVDEQTPEPAQPIAETVVTDEAPPVNTEEKPKVEPRLQLSPSEVEAKPVKPVEDKTIVAPKVDRFF